MANEEKNDIISEQSFVKEQIKMEDEVDLEAMDSAVSPQADSPGDSEEDATAEFLIGMNFRPEGDDAFEEEDDDDLENFEKSDRTNYAEQKSSSASETPSASKDEDGTFANRDIETLEYNDAAVVNSGRPSPRSDADRAASTN